MTVLLRALWPERELPSLLSALTGHATTSAGSQGLGSIPQFCRAAGWDAQEVPLLGGDAEAVLRATPFGVVQVSGKGWLCVMGSRRRKLRVLTPAFETISVLAQDIVREMSAGRREEMEGETAQLVEDWQMEERQAAGVARALAGERLANVRLGTAWRLSRGHAPRFFQQLVWERVPAKALVFAVASVFELVLMLAVWFVAGRMVFGSGGDSLAGGSPLAVVWATLLALTIPVRALGVWAQGKLVLALGGVLKRHLLLGALRIDVQKTMTEGSGQLLGRVIESEVLETLGLSGGLSTLMAFAEMAAAAAVLYQGAQGGGMTLLFLAVVAATLLAALRYARARQQWAAARLGLTHLTVEEMAGHRTRLAQQDPKRWHDAEDALMGDYVARSRTMDGIAEKLAPLSTGGWIVVGTAVIAWAASNGHDDATLRGVAAGGLLLGAQSLYRMANGLINLSGAWVAWKQVRPLFRAAGAPAQRFVKPTPAPRGDLVLEARHVDFAYPKSQDLVLKSCNLRIRKGDHVLLEGPTGSGKSTLAAIAASLHGPIDGLVYAGGHTFPTVGSEEWKRRVALSPQSHANHIFSAPLAFNLLLGRNWPPTRQDQHDALEVAVELGLGPLIDRMPAGLLQMVGETGWRLSQGEQSRVFIARALLQNADLVILDESFASLDPENLQRAVETVRKRAKSLMVVAHP